MFKKKKKRRLKDKKGTWAHKKKLKGSYKYSYLKAALNSPDLNELTV